MRVARGVVGSARERVAPRDRGKDQQLCVVGIDDTRCGGQPRGGGKLDADHPTGRASPLGFHVAASSLAVTGVGRLGMEPSLPPSAPSAAPVGCFVGSFGERHGAERNSDGATVQNAASSRSGAPLTSAPRFPQQRDANACCSRSRRNQDEDADVASPRLTGAWATRPTDCVEDAHRRLRAGSGLDHRVDNCCQNKPKRQSQQSSTKPPHSHGRRVPCVGSHGC